MKVSGDLKDLFEMGSPKVLTGTPKKMAADLKGYLHIVVVNSKGIRQITKTR
jgi:hypothetical protein